MGDCITKVADLAADHQLAGKFAACLEAVGAGVGKAHIINGTLGHSLLLEIFTDAGVGTEIVDRQPTK